ncbi:FkbM family methyltransferase [Bosea sp. Root381]|uniref:FkbM family methyltransferase n=1 Tax=Bosea sp. Root381 TaxID=1736524 RepID=UPI000A422607|nr:FkbM family methyltransferase [Bosea sp. Root381]
MTPPTASDAQEQNAARIVHGGKEFRFVHSDRDDHLLAIMRSSGAFYEAELLAALVPMVPREATVVDVGANIGNHSVFFAGVMGCRVIAIEPNPNAASLLARNLEINGLADRVEIRRCALGAERRRGRVSGAATHNLGMAAVEADEQGDIEIVPLDGLSIESPVALLKIDVEGAEYDVLVGATELLKAHRPVLVLEIARAEDYRRIAALLQPFGYVAAGSYNYTPTHIFRVPGKSERSAGQVGDLSHRLSLHYIDAMERTNSADRRLTKLRQQVEQLSAADDTTAQRLDAAETLRLREAEVLAGVRGTLAAQQAEATQQQTALADALHGIAGQLGAQQAGAKQEQAALADALHAITGQLAALGSVVSDLQGGLATLRSDVADLRKVARLDAGAMLELQLIAATEADAKLERLGARTDAALRHALEERLSDRLRHGFAELTSQLTTAIGNAIADRELADEICDPAGPFDIAKAMAALGIREPEQAPPAPKRDVWFVKGYSDRPKPATTRLPAAVAGTDAEPLPAELLGELDFAAGWLGQGWAQGETSLEAGGRVHAAVACPRLGFVGPAFPCAGGGLIEVEIELHELSPGASSPVLRLQTEAGFSVGHDFVLRQGSTTIRAFAPHRAKQLKFHVLMLNAPAGAAYRIGKAALRRIDGEGHQQEVRLGVKEPVLASLATIPSRREMLRDCVASLLPQCDRVRVFLNNYPDVPDFLNHPRIEVRRSQDWDDRGDAGKFFWIDKDRAEGGYRVIVDDDLIFPPDFVEVMTAKVAEQDKRAIFAAHGVLLRQPIARYYEPDARAATFHFGDALAVDRGVHIGATNALCFHASAVTMRWDDFKYCNSADVWLSLHARENRLPILTPARPGNWVRENTHAAPNDTIYRHSLKRTRSRFDSSHVQDAVLRHSWPLTVTSRERAKIGIAIAAGTAEGLGKAAEHWTTVASACRASTELVVILIHDGADHAVREAIANLRIPHETHLVDKAKLSGGLGTCLDSLHERLGLDALLVLDEGLRAKDPGDGADAGALLRPTADAEGLTVWNAGQGKGGKGKGCLAFARTASERGKQGLAALLGGDCLLTRAAVAQRQGRSFATHDLPAGAHGRPGIKGAASPRTALRSERIVTVNDVFQRVSVLNLDRRPDRWAKVSERLARAGIVAERFSAVDGTAPATAAEYAAYAAQPLHRVAPELPRITSERDRYMSYPSQMARIAHIEAEAGRKAIASAGAWGYLRSYEAILERSLESQDETLLVLDDDAVFHNDFKRLFAEAVAQLPDDWLIVQLGTLQYNWSEPWAQWRSSMLYQTNGAAIGSHAVGMRFDVLPFLLDHTKRMDLPYDIGPLSAATRAFPDRCFVIYPNLAIQALGDSDIGTSKFQKTRSIAEVAARHRWNLKDYYAGMREERAKGSREAEAEI